MRGARRSTRRCSGGDRVRRSRESGDRGRERRPRRESSGNSSSPPQAGIRGRRFPHARLRCTRIRRSRPGRARMHPRLSLPNARPTIIGNAAHVERNCRSSMVRPWIDPQETPVRRALRGAGSYPCPELKHATRVVGNASALRPCPELKHATRVVGNTVNIAIVVIHCQPAHVGWMIHLHSASDACDPSGGTTCGVINNGGPSDVRCLAIATMIHTRGVANDRRYG